MLQVVNLFNQQRMLSHGIRIIAARLPVPTRYECEAMRDVLDLDINGCGVKQV